MLQYTGGRVPLLNKADKTVGRLQTLTEQPPPDRPTKFAA